MPRSGLCVACNCEYSALPYHCQDVHPHQAAWQPYHFGSSVPFCPCGKPLVGLGDFAPPGWCDAMCSVESTRKVYPLDRPTPPPEIIINPECEDVGNETTTLPVDDAPPPRTIQEEADRLVESIVDCDTLRTLLDEAISAQQLMDESSASPPSPATPPPPALPPSPPPAQSPAPAPPSPFLGPVADPLVGSPDTSSPAIIYDADESERVVRTAIQDRYQNMVESAREERRVQALAVERKRSERKKKGEDAASARRLRVGEIRRNMTATVCPLCNEVPKSFSDHIRTSHRNDQLSSATLAEHGLYGCASGRPFASSQGLSSHKNRVGCTIESPCGTNSRRGHDDTSPSPSSPNSPPPALPEVADLSIPIADSSPADPPLTLHAAIEAGTPPPPPASSGDANDPAVVASARREDDATERDCPVCGLPRKHVLNHIRSCHGFHRFTPDEIRDFPEWDICDGGQVFMAGRGIASHRLGTSCSSESPCDLVARPRDEAANPVEPAAPARPTQDCPICHKKGYHNLLSHLRTSHKHSQFTEEHARASGLALCPVCEKLVNGGPSLHRHLLACQRNNKPGRNISRFPVTQKATAYPGICHLCNNGLRHTCVLVHFRLYHGDHTFSASEVEPYDLLACDCGRPIADKQGMGIHRALYCPLRVQRPVTHSLQPMSDESIPTDTLRSSLGPPEDPIRHLLVLPTTYKPVPISVVGSFILAAERSARAFIDNPSDDTLLDVLSIPKVALAQGLMVDANSAKVKLHAHPNVEWGRCVPPTPQPASTGETVTKLIRSGRLSSAARVLDGEATVATPTPEVLEQLSAKHPSGPADPFRVVALPRKQRFDPPSRGDLDLAFRSFHYDTSPGASGWTVPLLKTAMRSDLFCDFILHLTHLIEKGEAPGRKYLCASRLVPLEKKDGGVRPIAKVTSPT
ncbi:uncharacterized protein I303_107711 [Kwoniella dejecticola CBS 10117]|uniref:Uncharacterized protein n=1 Tax=Kwoniella dejecticola CBS 10117 TaxID=1296121 RepID=A0AAJ8KV90_9TREE